MKLKLQNKMKFKSININIYKHTNKKNVIIHADRHCV